MGGVLMGAAIGGGGMSVAIDPPVSYGSSKAGSCPPLTAIVAGAPGAISYLWEAIGGDPVTLANATTQTTTPSYPGVHPLGTSFFSTVKVTATSGGQNASATAQVEFVVNS